MRGNGTTFGGGESGEAAGPLRALLRARHSSPAGAPDRTRMPPKDLNNLWAFRFRGTVMQGETVGKQLRQKKPSQKINVQFWVQGILNPKIWKHSNPETGVAIIWLGCLNSFDG